MNVAHRPDAGGRPMAPPEAEVGSFHTFGPHGPVYEVIAVVKELTDGDWQMRIRMPESGEEANYSLRKVRTDPRAT